MPLSLDEADAWRGSVDLRERLVCPMLPSAALAATYAVALSNAQSRLSVTCTLSLDGVTGEGSASGQAADGLEPQLTKARESALAALARSMAIAVDRCDARFSAVAESQVQTLLSAEAPSPSSRRLVAGVRQGAYAAPFDSQGRTSAGHGRTRDAGYLAAVAPARSVVAGIGGYGLAPRRERGNVLGYLGGRQDRATRRSVADPERPNGAGAAIVLAQDVEVETLGVSLLRMQSLLSGLRDVMRADG